MKLILSFFVFASLPVLSHAALFEGHCTVLRQPSDSQEAKLLAYKEVSLNAGDSQVIFKDGNIIYEVRVVDVGGGKIPLLHNLVTTITYGAPNYLASASAGFDDKTVRAGGAIGTGVKVPGLPSFGCGSN